MTTARVVYWTGGNIPTEFGQHPSIFIFGVDQSLSKLGRKKGLSKVLKEKGGICKYVQFLPL